MATRLRRAIEELRSALGPRPFVLLFDPIHPDDQAHVGFEICKSDGLAPYAMLGLLECGHLSALEMMNDNRVSKSTGPRSDPEEGAP